MMKINMASFQNGSTLLCFSQVSSIKYNDDSSHLTCVKLNLFILTIMITGLYFSDGVFTACSNVLHSWCSRLAIENEFS